MRKILQLIVDKKVHFFRQVLNTIMLGGQRSVVWVVLLSLASALLEAVGVGSIMPFIAVATDPGMINRTDSLRLFQSWVGFDRNEFVVLLGLIFGIVTVIANLANAASMVALTKFNAKIGRVLSTRLLRSAMARPYTYFLTANTAEISALVLVSSRRVSDGIVSPFLAMIAKSVSALFILGVLVWTNPFVAFWVVVMIVPIYGLTFFAVRERLNHLGAEIAEEDRGSFRYINEALSGVKDLKILGRTEHVLNRFERSVRTLATAQTYGAMLSQLPKYVIETVGVLMIVGVILWGLVDTREPSGVLALAALYAYAGYRLMPAAQAIFGSVAIIKYNAIAIDVVTSELVGFDTEPSSSIAITEHGALERLICNCVELKDVTFRYQGKELPALHAVSIEIRRGDHIAIVGPSGSGKSTLLDVLVGLLHPERGGIYIDGRLLGQPEMPIWRSRIGYVPQSVFLTDASVTENIAFGIPPELIDERRVQSAAEAAQLHGFIESSLPEGYQTQVGERGIKLSGGQRQRLGIARSLYHDPELLILDEATNALDSATESAFMSTIRVLAGSRTVISVAHRLSSVEACDKIYVMSEGRVVAAGRYDALEKTSAEFQYLLKTRNREQN